MKGHFSARGLDQLILNTKNESVVNLVKEFFMRFAP